MKTVNKLGLLGVFATACAFSPLVAHAATSLPAADENGVVTLTENVDLTSAIVLKADSNIKTIDLNGYTLTRPGYYGYLINSSTDLTIKNGNIVCEKEEAVANGSKPESSSSSCVRNNGTLNVEKVKIDAYWTALKSEEGTTVTIKDSQLSSESGTAGTILNYGTARIENSTVRAAEVPTGAAIFTMSYAESADRAWGGTVVVNGSTIEGYWPVLLGYYDAISNEHGLPTTVTFEGENTIKVSSEEGEFMHKHSKNTKEDDTMEISGKITAPIDALEYLNDGDTLVLNEDVTEDIEIPVGVTVVVPEGITVADGVIKMEKGAVLENKSGEVIKVTLLGDEEKTVEVKNDEVFDGSEKQEPDDNPNPDNPDNPNQPEPENPSDQEKPDKKPDVNNPQTFDGVTGYAALALLSVGGVGLVLKKNLK